MGACAALVTIFSATQKSLDSGQEVHQIGHDFNAIFDCVNHEVLVFKQIGIGGVYLNTIIQFLEKKNNEK